MTMTRPTPFFEDVAVGADIPVLVKTPTSVQIFRYSAVTWNSHRVHFETEYARAEGHPDVLVQAHLHGAFLAQMLMDWIGPHGRIVSYGWANRGRAVPGDRLTCQGTVVGKKSAAERGLVEVEIKEVNQSGTTCAVGTAVVALPVRDRRQ